MAGDEEDAIAPPRRECDQLPAAAEAPLNRPVEKPTIYARKENGAAGKNRTCGPALTKGGSRVSGVLYVFPKLSIAATF